MPRGLNTRLLIELGYTTVFVAFTQLYSLGRALKRIPVYERKLGMVYATCEQTLPEVTRDQAAASIA